MRSLVEDRVSFIGMMDFKLSGQFFILFSDFGVLGGDVGVFCENVVQFGIDGDVVGSDLIMQIFLVFFNFGHL